jgi:hypothetical protein
VFVSTCLAYAGYDGKEELTEDICRHLVLRSMISYRKKFGSEYGKLVICCDGPFLWRKKVYPYYKASRKAGRENSPIDWKELLRIKDLLIEEFRENIPYRVVRVNGAEGDDCIAVLARETPGPHLIVSNDDDFGQLQRYEGVKQYSPRKEKILNIADPEAFLKEHIIRGDSGDGVPNVLSDDDCFVSTPKKRQKSVMTEKLKVWMNQDYSEFCDPDKLKRNIAMIDFESIPDEIAKEILQEFNDAPIIPKSNVILYFGQKRLRTLIDEISHI